MLIISDIHGAFEALRRVARAGRPLLILGDFLNYVDYRTGEGMVAELFGIEFARRVASARKTGAFEEARALWSEAGDRLGGDLGPALRREAVRQYEAAAAALDGGTGFATFGNVDVPDLLQKALPDGFRFVNGTAVEIEGWMVGFVGGAHPSPFQRDDPVTEEVMGERLSQLGPVDVLCTHVPPAVDPLRIDTITGRRERSSRAVLEYLLQYQPAFHFFGDVHQPRAHRWRIGATVARNVGYFRATGRPVELAGRSPSLSSRESTFG